MYPTFSIIVPIYNAAAYLRNCIESVLYQTNQNFELLLINDGSTDNCYEICKEYAENTSKIKLFNQANSGVSAARNVGLDNATGDFILFLDADDTIENCTLSDFSDFCLDKKQLDILQFGYTEINKKEKKTTSPPSTFIYSSVSYFKLKICSPGISGNLLKRNLIGDIRFTYGIKLAEDIEFMIKVFCKARSIATINKSYYNYILRDNSATISKVTTEKALDYLKVSNNLFMYVNSMATTEKSDILIYTWINNLYKNYFYTLSKLHDKHEIKYTRATYAFYRRLYMKYMPLKYKLKEPPIIIANLSMSSYIFILKYVRGIH